MEWSDLPSKSVGCAQCVARDDVFVLLKRVDLSTEGPFQSAKACPRCGKVYDLFVAPEQDGQQDSAELGLDPDAEI